MPERDAAISVHDLHVTMNDVPILRGIAASFTEGSKTLIIGQNGAGKTTLLRVILGLVSYQRGSVRVNGAEVGSSSWRGIRRSVGYVPQDRSPSDFPVSACEVVEIGVCESRLTRTERREKVLRAMEATGCLHLRERRYSTLSGGEKQRVSIARCLCQDPGILLLDEPSSSLDAGAKGALLSIMNTINRERGITLVMVSHDPHYADDPGWIKILLKDGLASGAV